MVQGLWWGSRGGFRCGSVWMSQDVGPLVVRGIRLTRKPLNSARRDLNPKIPQNLCVRMQAAPQCHRVQLNFIPALARLRPDRAMLLRLVHATHGTNSAALSAALQVCCKSFARRWANSREARKWASKVSRRQHVALSMMRALIVHLIIFSGCRMQGQKKRFLLLTF